MTRRRGTRATDRRGDAEGGGRISRRRAHKERREGRAEFPEDDRKIARGVRSVHDRRQLIAAAALQEGNCAIRDVILIPVPKQSGQQEMLKIEKISHRPAVRMDPVRVDGDRPGVLRHQFLPRAPFLLLVPAWLDQRPFQHCRAETFANLGIGAFGGVPIVNNPPFGLAIEAYLHWPPLFQMVLAGVYRIFGVSEGVSHAMMFVILILNTFLLGLLAHRCAGTVAAQFACLAWLGCGVMGLYSHLVWNLHLMLGLVFLALLGFVNAESNWRWAVVGALSFAAAIASSWEAVFVCPGILAVSLWSRDRVRIKLAAIYTLIAVVVPLSILLNSAYHYPQQMTEVGQRVLFRMGLVNEYVSTYETSSRRPFEMPSAWMVIWTIARRNYHYIGVIPLMAAGWMLVNALASYRERRREDSLVVFAGLVSMGWLWVVLFHSHVYIHDCHILIVAPAAAFAAGVVGQRVTKLLDRRLPDSARLFQLLLVIIVPLILLTPLVRATRNTERFISYGTEKQLRVPEFFAEVEFGLNLLRDTESGSVVITPAESAVPLYYSQRHLIQGVGSERDFRSALIFARKNFPGSPLYLAIPSDLAQKFEAALAEGKIVGRRPGMILVRLANQVG